MITPSSSVKLLRIETHSRRTGIFSNLNSMVLFALLGLGFASTGIVSNVNAEETTPNKPLKRTFETLKGEKFECGVWGLRESEIGLTLPNGESFWVSIKNVSQADRDWIDLRRPQIAEYIAKSRTANAVETTLDKPLKRTFANLKGEKFECGVWGLRQSEIGLTLPNGESFWVSIKNVSQADRDWIDLRRPQIAEYVAKSHRVFLTKFQAADSNVSTEALQSRLVEDWSGELNREDNKFVEIAKVTGINNVDRESLQSWFQQLRAGLKYDQASKDIVWSIPSGANFVGSESVKEIYSQLVLGTLLQKIGVSDVDQWRTHVKIEFVAPKTGEKELNDKPHKDAHTMGVVKSAGELSVVQCCCNGTVVEVPVCGQTFSTSQSNSFSCGSSDPCSPSVECEETLNRCRIFGRRR